MASVEPSDRLQRPAYQAIVDALIGAGVTDVFGLMGDDTAKLVTELAGRRVRYHDARHENAAVAMAAGYASASGQLGVCVLSRGPGLTNGLTAIVNAGKGGARLLVIAGADGTASAPNAVAVPDGKSYDSSAFAGGWYRQCTPARPEAISAALQEALAAAEGGLPAGLHIPKNLFEAPVEPFTISPTPEPGPTLAPDDAGLETAMAVLSAAQRPLIVAGGGAALSGAGPALAQLAERRGAFLATTLRAKDLFRGHPRDLGIIGTFSHSVGRSYFDEADCVIAFGAGLNQYTTSKGEALPDAPIIHVDVERSHIGRYYRADVAVVGDARVVAEALCARLPALAEPPEHVDELERRVATFSAAEDYEPADTRWTIDPRSLVLLLDELLPADRSVVTDTGNFFGHVPPHIHVDAPDRFKQSSDFSAIGLGLGTALGVATARQPAPTILFVGDGSALMALGELETLARLALPLVVVVMNDAAYGAERHYLELQGLPGAKCVYPETDFAAIAEAIGLEGATVRSEADLRGLAPRLQDVGEPLLLDCKVTPSVIAPFIGEALASGGAVSR